MAALALLVMVLTVRALMFRPHFLAPVTPFGQEVDGERAVASLQKMIQCKTVSHDDTSLEDQAEFVKFRILLKELYPLVHQHLELKNIGRAGLLYRWPGKSSAQPTVLMSHYDVVPAEEESWQQPPFAGVIEEGCLWGRGTLDTKGTLCGIMEAAEHLLNQGFVPEQDIYLTFGGDEETSGASAQAMVDYLEEKGVRPHLVVDEGGAVVEGVVPGVQGRIALVGTGEKGKLHVRLSVKSSGGHGSAPPPHTPIGILAKAICAIEAKPMNYHLPGPAREMLDTLGRHAGFGFRLIYANLGFFAPLLNLIAKKLGGEINALIRTTVAFTKMKASDAVNVFPPLASVDADIRLMEGATKDTVIGDLRARIKNERVEVEAINTIEVRPFAKTGTPAWQRLQESILQTWPDVKVAPYLMLAATDSRHFTQISENVLRFSAMELSREERKTIHGHDERIPLAKVETAVRFFTCLMQKC
jgi:carboxypeptidase PM20D1